MQHPLAKPTLAPFGFVLPYQKQRLAYKPPGDMYGLNAERIIGRIWARWNRATSTRSLPIRTIVHEILPALDRKQRLTKGDFVWNGEPYRTRDIRVLSTVIQWFGTNCGTGFLEDREWDPINHRFLPQFHGKDHFVRKFEREMRRRDMVAFWLHICDKRCALCSSLFGMQMAHYYDPKKATTRDRLLVMALMQWLGTDDGRSFLTEGFRIRKLRAEAKWHHFRRRTALAYTLRTKAA